MKKGTIRKVSVLFAVMLALTAFAGAASASHSGDFQKNDADVWQSGSFGGYDSDTQNQAIVQQSNQNSDGFASPNTNTQTGVNVGLNDVF